MRSRLSCGLLIGLSLSLCAMAGEQKPGDKQLAIGFSLAEFESPIFVEMRKGAEAEAGALGVNLMPMGAHLSSEMQPDHIDILVEKHVDGLLVNPVPYALLAPAIDAAVDAGVPVVKVLADPGPDKALAVVGTDVAQGARLAARFVIDKLGGSGTVLVLEARGLEALKVGFEKELQGSNVKVLASAPAGMLRYNAKQVMAGLIREHPQFDAVLGVNDVLVLGAIDAMVEAGIDPAGKVTVGADATPDGRRAIAEGRLGATIDPRAGEQARQALRILVDYIRTKKMPTSKQILVAPKLITKASPEG
jgi:ABC-type sugar transport system substrate-binding protein